MTSPYEDDEPLLPEQTRDDDPRTWGDNDSARRRRTHPARGPAPPRIGGTAAGGIRMELRGFSDEYGRLVAGWAASAQEVALLCGRVEYPFPEELTGSWRKVTWTSTPICIRRRPAGRVRRGVARRRGGRGRARPDHRGSEGPTRPGIGPDLVRALADAGDRRRPPGHLPPGQAGQRARDQAPTSVSASWTSRQQEMDEWNAAQPVAYRWMRYPLSS